MTQFIIDIDCKSIVRFHTYVHLAIPIYFA